MKKGQIYTCRFLKTKYQVSKVDDTIHGVYAHFVELDDAFRPIPNHSRIVHISKIDIKKKLIL